jgi:hypothetical protein
VGASVPPVARQVDRCEEEGPTYKERWMNRSSAINPPTALRSYYMQMRKSILAATAAAAMLLPLAAATVAEASPAASKTDVLTTGKVGGTNVAAKATLSASLPKKGTVTFSVGSIFGASCPTASMTFSVVKNPAKPGSASLNLTKSTVGGKCKFSGTLGPDVTSLSMSLKKAPYAATISDAKGDPVTITNEVVKVVVVTSISGVGTLTCYYTAKTLKGAYSNKNSGISFSKQKLTLVKSGSSADCEDVKSATYKATYAPTKDTSVKGSPSVFVN